MGRFNLIHPPRKGAGVLGGGHGFVDKTFGGIQRVMHIGLPGCMAREFHEIALPEEAGDEVAVGVGELLGI
jgi:hypothetical protein